MLPDDQARLWGAYYRARVLLKNYQDMKPARELLEALRNSAGGSGDDNELFGMYVERRYAEALIGMREPAGRDVLLNLLRRVGGQDADAAPDDRDRARLLAELCGDLSLIGEHDAAIAIGRRMAERQLNDGLRAHRLSLLSAWLLQRAVAARADRRIDDARGDLKEADAAAQRAVSLRQNVQQETGEWDALAMREVQAIDLSISIERSAIDPDEVNLDAAIDDMKQLLMKTPLEAVRGDPRPLIAVEAPNPPAETPIQLALRLGRLGSAHARRAPKLDGEARARGTVRGLAYLRASWDYMHNAPVRHWIPLDYCEALIAADRVDEACRFAREAADRLSVQCGTPHPVVGRLREIAGEQKLALSND